MPGSSQRLAMRLFYQLSHASSVVLSTSMLLPNAPGFGYHESMNQPSILSDPGSCCAPAWPDNQAAVSGSRRAAHRLVSGLVLFCMALFASAAQALPVEGLYEQLIEVSDQGDAERRRAYREAFSRVIVKVSGELRWLDHPAVRGALAAPDNYVAEVSYRTRQGQTAIDVRFDQQLIEDLLVRAEIPIWDRNRASVLLWLTVQDASGRRVMLGSGSDHELHQQARVFSEQRGLPVLIPILDLTDRQLVTQDESWALDDDALRAAGERYGADSVLAARLLEMPGGELVGLWKFIFRDQVQTFDHMGAIDQRYVEQPLDTATSILAQHFALLPRDLEREDEVLLRVDGITDLSNHRILIDYLESLSLIRDVRLAAIRPDGLDLRITMVADRYRLAELISLDRDLRPEGFELGGTLSDVLHYQWTR